MICALTPQQEANLVAYQQLGEMIRHLQDHRFAALTAFLVITGALLTVAIRRPAHIRIDQWPPRMLRVAGVLVAIIFGFVELRIFLRITEYTEKIEKLGTLESFPMDSIGYTPPSYTYGWGWFGFILMILIYLGTIYLWYRPQHLREYGPVQEP